MRSALVLSAAALCLWALYSLLSSLREPGLLRSQKAAVLKGCEVLTDPSIRQTCLPLFCQKALIDSKLAPWDARFTVHVQRPSAADAQLQVVTGSIAVQSDSHNFACLVKGPGVAARRLVTDDELDSFIRAADEDPDSLSET